MLNLRTLSLLALLLLALSAHPQAANPSNPPPTAEAQKLLDAGHLEQALKTLDPQESNACAALLSMSKEKFSLHPHPSSEPSLRTQTTAKPCKCKGSCSSAPASPLMPFHSSRNSTHQY